LEIGELTYSKKGKQPSGKYSISIEWSWRIEDGNSIALGSWSENEEINKIKELLKDQTITKLNYFGRLKEIELELSNGLWLLSFATSEGDPQWTVYSNGCYLFFKKGRFVCEDNR